MKGSIYRKWNRLLSVISFYLQMFQRSTSFHRSENQFWRIYFTLKDRPGLQLVLTHTHSGVITFVVNKHRTWKRHWAAAIRVDVRPSSSVLSQHSWGRRQRSVSWRASAAPHLNLVSTQTEHDLSHRKSFVVFLFLILCSESSESLYHSRYFRLGQCIMWYNNNNTIISLYCITMLIL